MMIALIGATGNVGSRLLAELLRRGHDVTGIARHPERLQSQPHVTVRRGDANDEQGLAKLLIGHDAVISAGRFVSVNPGSLIAAVKKAGVKRLLVVGGAGSLEVAPGVQLVDTPDFPAEYKPEAQAGRDFLNMLRSEKELNWTFLSPSAVFFPGERTGKFRLGADQLLTGEDGESRISMEDFAVAFADEIESPHHPRQRFTVGY
jgi:uncharacterized protein